MAVTNVNNSIMLYTLYNTFPVAQLYHETYKDLYKRQRN